MDDPKHQVSYRISFYCLPASRIFETRVPLTSRQSWIRTWCVLWHLHLGRFSGFVHREPLTSGSTQMSEQDQAQLIVCDDCEVSAVRTEVRSSTHLDTRTERPQPTSVSSVSNFDRVSLLNIKTYKPGANVSARMNF